MISRYTPFHLSMHHPNGVPASRRARLNCPMMDVRCSRFSTPSTYMTTSSIAQNIYFPSYNSPSRTADLKVVYSRPKRKCSTNAIYIYVTKTNPQKCSSHLHSTTHKHNNPPFPIKYSPSSAPSSSATSSPPQPPLPKSTPPSPSTPLKTPAHTYTRPHKSP